MSRWNRIVEEAPSSDLERRTLDGVEVELSQLRQDRRAQWRNWLLTLVPVAAVASGVLWWRGSNENDLDPDVTELVLESEFSIEDMEILEEGDLDLLEDLEELEKWNS